MSPFLLLNEEEGHKMKTKNMVIIAVLVISAFFVGKLSNMDTINMNKVVNVQANEYGAQITLLDGNGYYWER